MSSLKPTQFLLSESPTLLMEFPPYLFYIRALERLSFPLSNLCPLFVELKIKEFHKYSTERLDKRRVTSGR